MVNAANAPLLEALTAFAHIGQRVSVIAIGVTLALIVAQLCYLIVERHSQQSAIANGPPQPR